MALAEILLLGFGTGITKGILKVWLQDHTIAQEASIGGLDFKQKITDIFDQRATRQQFEQISDRIVKQVLELLEREWSHLDEASQIAVADAAGRTLDRAGLTAEMVIAHDLEPDALQRHFLAADPEATRHFGEDEAALYRRLLSQASQYIVDIATHLPNFHKDTYAELLQRDNILIARTDQILDQVRQLRTDGADKAAQFEDEYRRAVLRRCDRLSLFGIDVSETSKRYRLSVAYVTLSVAQAAADGDDEGLSTTLAVDEALAANTCLLIRGPAGSGKTTLLQWAAVQVASRNLQGALESWNDRVPFILRLRDYAEEDLPGPEDFVARIAKPIKDTMPEGWVNQQLDSGRGLVLIDGLDELPQERREEVREWLQDLVGTYHSKGAIFALTTRPYAAEEGWLSADGFQEAELQEMTPPDIDQFFAHWHAAVREGVQEPERKDELDEYADKLKQTLRQNSALRLLATSPLLCAMLCALHWERYQNLPSDRVELYRACIDMFFRRDLERKIALKDYPELSDRGKWALLEDLAYWLIRNGWSEVSEEKGDEHLDKKIKGLSFIAAGTTGTQVRELFVHRSGILRQPVVGMVDFPHRTFQEFLAAKAAVEEGNFGELTKNAHDDQWHEVVVLAAGLARKKEYRSLIENLIERGDKEKGQQASMYLLAVGCMDTALEPGDALETRVAERLKKIVPPKNFTQAKTLARAGDLVVPHLKFSKKLKAAQAAACIRTLALISSEAALDLLKTYNGYSRQAVENERAYGIALASDPDAYARHAFAGISQVKLTENKAVHAFMRVPLDNFVDLRSLNLNNCSNLTDLNDLQGPSQLQHLDLSACANLTDISGISRLSQLQQLDLSNCGRLVDISEISRLSKLQQLDLNRCRSLTDLSVISRLPQLIQLNLSNCRSLVDISGIGQLSQLQQLDLGYCGSLVDISAISRLSRLQQLDLSWCRNLTDLSVISRLPQLIQLRLSECRSLIDISAINRLSKLRQLDLSLCRSLTDVGDIRGLPQLKYLDLRSNPQISAQKIQALQSKLPNTKILS